MISRIIIFLKKERENILLFILFLLIIFTFIFFKNNSQLNFSKNNFFEKSVIKKQEERFQKNLIIKKNEINLFKNKGCQEILIDKRSCFFEKENCLDILKIPKTITCKKWKTIHLKKPKFLKTLYYNSYAGNSENKIEKLISYVKNTEINSVVIDVKEVDGKVAFDMTHFNFGKIKPKSNNILKNPKKLIEKLHNNGIYVIGRIVVFKDKYLAEKRPDLALKNKLNGYLWTDRSGKKYLDPNSKEVWDYTVNLAKVVYITGFDEINFDYIRYPSDGKLSNIKFPFSEKEIEKDKKWGRAKVIDKFFNYLTLTLRKEFPKIQLSGDLFGYIAITNDDLKIGQLIETAILYFDRIAPMTYPSHYNKHFLGLNSADSNPYIVIKETMKKVSKKIKRLNLEIEKAQKEKTKIFIKSNFYSDINPEKLKKISKDKVMIWLQGFSCTWCQNHIRYGKKEIQLQSKAAKEEGYENWFIWNAASRYGNWFDK